METCTYTLTNFRKKGCLTPAGLLESDLFQIEASTLGDWELSSLAIYIRQQGYTIETAVNAVRASFVFGINVPAPHGFMGNTLQEWELSLTANQQLKLSLIIFLGGIASEILFHNESAPVLLKMAKEGEIELEKKRSDQELDLEILERKVSIEKYRNWDRDLDLIEEIFDAATERIEPIIPKDYESKKKILNGIKDFDDPRYDLQISTLGLEPDDKATSLLLELEAIEALIQIEELEAQYEYFLFKKELTWEQRRLSEWTEHIDLIERVRISMSKRLLTLLDEELVRD